MILAVIFATEYVLMFALLWMLPANAARFLEAAIDAALLTIVGCYGGPWYGPSRLPNFAITFSPTCSPPLKMKRRLCQRE